MSASEKIKMASELCEFVKDKSEEEKRKFISPEQFILIKLKWYKTSQSSKHLEDAESVLTISGEKLDMDYLNKWAEKLGVLEILNKINK